jgi:membrane dipeptidase
MKKCIAVLLLLGSHLLIFAQSYKKLHFKAIVVDTHNDILTTAINKGFRFDTDLKGKTHSDLSRWAAGGVDVQVFSIWCDGTFGKGKAFARANQQIDTLYAVAERNPDKMMIVSSAADLQKAVKQHKLAAMLGVEGGHMIEDRLDYLDSLYRRGVRYMTLTWNNSTDWATSAMYETRGQRRDTAASPQPSRSATGTSSPVEGGQNPAPRQNGLTDFGKQVVRRMNELGMLVDVSHVGEQTFWDAIHLSTKPVIASHSCAHALCPVFRNLKDDQLTAIAKNGGVIHINFFSGFVDSSFTKRNRAFNQKHRAERDSLLKTVTDAYFADDYLFEKYHEEAKDLRPPLSMLLDHIDYIVKLAGIDHVGLGSDFDGISSVPQQLDDVTTYPIITRELLKRGYSKKDIRKILGANFIRVFKANSKK